MTTENAGVLQSLEKHMVSDRSVELKQELVAVLAQCDGDGRLDEAAFAEMKTLVDDMSNHSPVPDPIRQPRKVDGSWQTVFASFGVRHSAAKPVRHASTLKLQSFKHLPDTPIQVNTLIQEIDSASGAYNNVICFDARDGAVSGTLIVSGTYTADEINPKRFHVWFHRVHVRIGESAPPQVRALLGLPDDAPVDVTFKPPRVHSDIVYLDDEMRINLGSVGGTYILQRRAGAPLSI